MENYVLLPSLSVSFSFSDANLPALSKLCSLALPVRKKYPVLGLLLLC
jgi:hypothetical protein